MTSSGAATTTRISNKYLVRRHTIVGRAKLTGFLFEGGTTGEPILLDVMFFWTMAGAVGVAMGFLAAESTSDVLFGLGWMILGACFAVCTRKISNFLLIV